MQTIYGRHLEPETLVYGGLPSPAIAQFTVNSYIRAVKYSTGVTLASTTLNISNPATSPLFLSNPSVDLRWTKGFYITLTDGAAKTMKVLVGAAGTGEVLGDELITTAWTNNVAGLYESFASTGGDNVTAENSSGVGIATSTVFNIPANTLLKLTDSFNLVSGAVNKISSLLSNPDLGAPEVMYVTPVISSGHAIYKTEPTGTRVLCYYCNASGSFAATGISLKTVTTPSATGVSFSAPTVDSGFDYNAASYTCTVTLS